MNKYIFENGVMKLNPEYQSANPSTAPSPAASLAVVSSNTDISQATSLQAENQREFHMTAATNDSLGKFNEEAFLQSYQAEGELTGDAVLANLSEIFAIYEVPMGMLSKLLALSEYNINFYIDDSGSMRNNTDSKRRQACGYMKELFEREGKSLRSDMTRWEEAEDRLHVQLDVLTNIPTGKITISFLNRADEIVLERQGKTIDAFKAKAHNAVRAAFAKNASGGTPIYRVLSQGFKNASGYTQHYLFTDGVPSDRSTTEVGRLVLNRKHPRKNPLTFISCTNEDDQTEWMKDIEGKAAFAAELDDFSDETDEVMVKQGKAFPYTKGLWLISQLVAAINPDDLDALDEDYPLSKYNLDGLLGRELTSEEYEYYWDNHPCANRKFRDDYESFLTKPNSAKEILEEKKAARHHGASAAGYGGASYTPGYSSSRGHHSSSRGHSGASASASKTHSKSSKKDKKHKKSKSKRH